MKTKFKIHEIAAISALLLFVILSVTLITRNRSINNSLKNEKIINEALLSEKMKLTHNAEKLKKGIESLAKEKKNQESKLLLLKSQLEQKEAELADQKQKGNLAISNLKSTIENLQKEWAAINEKYMANTKELAILTEKNKQLQSQLDFALNEKDEIFMQNELLKAILGDNYCTEAVRGKQDKVTMWARRTNKLSLSLDLAHGNYSDLYFTITAPNGKIYSSTDNHQAEFSIDYDLVELASLDNILKPEATTRVQLNYKPQSKLSKGVYKFNIYNNDNYIGSTQLKLR